MKRTNFFLLLFFAIALAISEDFVEELLLRPAPDGKLIAHFQFTTTRDANDVDTFEHFTLFPKSLGQTINNFEVEELHLSFTQGRWWNELWGYPISVSPIGLEFYAWFKEGSQQRVESLWKGLTYALAGLTCSSMEEMSATLTSQPQFSIEREGLHNIHRNATSNELLRYSILPREAVCTENLTPWIKLLPCRSQSGIATLLNSLKLYDVSYHSMGTHFRTITNQGRKVMEIQQTLSVVFNAQNAQEWTLQSIFGRNSVESCPLASKSLVYIQHATNPSISIQLEPAATSYDKSSQLSTFDLKTREESLPLKITWTHATNATAPAVPLIARRYFTGYGEEYGGLTVEIRNNEAFPIRMKYFESIPWYLRLFFHMMKFHINGAEFAYTEVLDRYRFIPGEDHGAPSTVEFEIKVPAQSTLTITVQFEKAFLHWTEHPPDAHRGFDVGSAVIVVSLPCSHYHAKFNGLEWSPTLYSNNCKRNLQHRIVTDSLLVQLPTPDFSMPYNVITLTGTIFALFFGSAYNTLIRRGKDMDQLDNDYVANRPIARILRFLMSLLES